MLPIKQSINKINGSMHHQCIFCILPAGEDPKRKCWNLTLKPPIHWCHHGRTKLQNLFANRHHLLLLFFTRCFKRRIKKENNTVSICMLWERLLHTAFHDLHTATRFPAATKTAAPKHAEKRSLLIRHKKKITSNI